MTQWVAVDDSNFEAAVVAASYDRPVVLLIGAQWCGHCQPLADDLDAVLDPLGDAVVRTKLWVDRPGLVRGTLTRDQQARSVVSGSLDRLGSVTSLPRTLVLRNGEAIEGFNGRPIVDAELVRFSVWLQALVGDRRSVTLSNGILSRIRRLAFYRGRMGLGAPLPTIADVGGIPNSADSTQSQ